MLEALLAAFERYQDKTAIVWRERAVSYRWLKNEIETLRARLDAADGPPLGPVVALSSDYSPRAVAWLLALVDRGRTVALISPGFDKQRDELLEVAEVESELVLEGEGVERVVSVGHPLSHALLVALSTSGKGGLVLFSSGSAGKVKAVVHDAARLFNKYRVPRRANVTIPFMLFDHIGGINTLLHVLSSGGTAVFAPDRTPETICRLVAAHRVQVLPATPTFLRLLLLHDRSAHDLSSLEILAYGAERMSEATLEHLRRAFPAVSLVQNYGLSEVGIMQTKSEDSGSLWVRLGGEGYQTRVRDGLLEIKAETAMLGYLNEASPFTDDGWLRTGDQVEVKGEYFRILGRASDIIIVGGEKVYPAEVEDLIASMPGVVEVIVSGEPNAITGQNVKAEVQLGTDETRESFRARMQSFLGSKLPAFKVPQRVRISKEPLHTERFKKRRS